MDEKNFQNRISFIRGDWWVQDFSSFFPLNNIEFKNQDLNKMVLKLKSANYCYLIISMIFGFFAYIFRALRWQILINTMQYSSKFGPALHSISIGYLANVIFPRAGEIVRCTYFNQVTKVPVKKLIGNVILERVIDLSILIVLLLINLYLGTSRFVGAGPFLILPEVS